MAGERPPVKDHAGHAVWRVRVGPGEVTCANCGETWPPALLVGVHGDNDSVGGGQRCYRCGSHRLHPTLDYLQDSEWEKT